MSSGEVPVALVQIESELPWDERCDPRVIEIRFEHGEWVEVEEEDEATLVFG